MRTEENVEPSSEGPSSGYRRVLLKIAGSSFAPKDGYGLDLETVNRIARQLAGVDQMGAEVSVVVGGGNIFRGAEGQAHGMDRGTADYMGMLATVINALALRDALEKYDVETRVQTAIWMQEIAEPFIRGRAMRHLEKGRAVIFAAGTGNPYFSTDTTAALRALEVGADAIFMGKRVEGVFDADPLTNPDATFLPDLSYIEVLERNLKVMDGTAITLCRDHGIPIHVFNLLEEGNIERVFRGERIGTVVH